MTGYSVLLTCQNKQEARSLLPIADALRSSTDEAVTVDFLSQDDVYAQNVDDCLEAAGEEPMDLGLPFSLKSPYTTGPWYSKPILFYLLDSSLEPIAKEYDAIVSGIDGLPVRILAQHARETDTELFQLVVSFHDEKPDDGRSSAERVKQVGKQKLKRVLTVGLGYEFLTYPHYPGGSHSGKMFVPGRRVKRTLVERGVNEDRIRVTGTPRFRSLYSEEQKIAAPSETERSQILYLPSAFKLHGYERLQTLQREQIEAIASWVSDRSDLCFRIKPHPREDSAQYESVRKLDSVSVLDANYDIYDAIRESDVVTTVVSTAAYEAALLRRPVVLGLFPETERFGRWDIATDFPTAESEAEYANTVTELTGEDDAYVNAVESQVKTAQEVIDPSTPDSDEAIAQHIVRGLRDA